MTATRREQRDPATYQDPHHDERQERRAASDDGPRTYMQIGGCDTAGAWGGDDE